MTHTRLAVLLAAIGGGGFLLPLREPWQGVWYSTDVTVTIPDFDPSAAFQEVPETEANGVLVLHYWFPGLSDGRIDDFDGDRYPIHWNPHATEPGFSFSGSILHWGHGDNTDGTGANEYVRLGGKGWGTIDVEVSGSWRGRGGKNGDYKTTITMPWRGEPVVRDLGRGAHVRVSFDDPKPPRQSIDNEK